MEYFSNFKGKGERGKKKFLLSCLGLKILDFRFDFLVFEEFLF